LRYNSFNVGRRNPSEYVAAIDKFFVALKIAEFCRIPIESLVPVAPKRRSKAAAA